MAIEMREGSIIPIKVGDEIIRGTLKSHDWDNHRAIVALDVTAPMIRGSGYALNDLVYAVPSKDPLGMYRWECTGKVHA